MRIISKTSQDLQNALLKFVQFYLDSSASLPKIFLDTIKDNGYIMNKFMFVENHQIKSVIPFFKQLLMVKYPLTGAELGPEKLMNELLDTKFVDFDVYKDLKMKGNLYDEAIKFKFINDGVFSKEMEIFRVNEFDEIENFIISKIASKTKLNLRIIPPSPSFAYSDIIDIIIKKSGTSLCFEFYFYNATISSDLAKKKKNALLKLKKFSHMMSKVIIITVFMCP